MKTLSATKCGDTVIVTGLRGNKPFTQRLIDMGITRGTRIFVKKFAPLGDPIEIKIRNYSLAIRKKDAGLIEVK